MNYLLKTKNCKLITLINKDYKSFNNNYLKQKLKIIKNYNKIKN